MKITGDSYLITLFGAYLTFFFFLNLTFLLIYIFIFVETAVFQCVILEINPYKTNIAARLLNQPWVPKVASDVQIVNFYCICRIQLLF